MADKMTETIPRYIAQLETVRDDIQDKLDNMEEPEYDSQQEKFDELYSKREEQIECLESIIEHLEAAEELIDEFTSQWRGISSIK